MNARKILVIGTALLFLVILILMSAIAKRRVSGAIEINGALFGDRQAPVEVVLFEDFKCYACRNFSQNMLPKLESEYLASEKIRLKLIPLGFLDNSRVLANAALEVYQLAPEKFLPFSKLLFAHFVDREIDSSTTNVLMQLAQEVGGIDLDQLKICIDEGCHDEQLDRSLDQARALMGKKFRLPALYINGVRVKTTNYQAIQREMKRAEK